MGVALLAVLFFVGGLIDVFGVPAHAKRRRRRKPVGPRQEPDRPSLSALPEGLATAVRRWDAASLIRRRVTHRHKQATLRSLATQESSSWRTPTQLLEAVGESTWSPVPSEVAKAPALEGEGNSRSLMFATSAVLVAVILGIILVFRGGGPVRSQPSPGPLGLTPAQQATALAARGDYMGAWSLYHQALQAAPEDVSLWYSLAVTLSHLNQRKETEEAFRYVVQHGKPGSEEVRLARHWLLSAGVLVEPVAFAPAPDPVGHSRGDAAVVRGKVTWGAPDSGRPVRVQLLLAGLNGAAEGKRFTARAALGSTYQFERLPAGTYRLLGVAAGQRLWDLTLSVEDGKELILDLSKDNSNNPTVEVYP